MDTTKIVVSQESTSYFSKIKMESFINLPIDLELKSVGVDRRKLLDTHSQVARYPDDIRIIQGYTHVGIGGTAAITAGSAFETRWCFWQLA